MPLELSRQGDWRSEGGSASLRGEWLCNRPHWPSVGHAGCPDHTPRRPFPGSFLHTLESPSFRASQRIYAHRALPHVMAFSVSISRVAVGDGPVTVLLRSTFSPKSPDLDLHLGPDFQGAR